jgi:hypothetical protein
VHDPELGRMVQPWVGMHADSLARSWLRYGPDRLDKLAEVRRLHRRGSSRSCSSGVHRAMGLTQHADRCLQDIAAGRRLRMPGLLHN